MLTRVYKATPTVFWKPWMSCVVAILLVLLSACTDSTPIERTFSMQDLLVDASIFPEGWEIGGGPRFVEWDQYSSSFGSWYINFQANTDAPWKNAGLHVYQYHNVTISKRMYEEITTSPQHRGEKILLDACDRLYAAQSQLNCESYSTHDQMRCNWSGLYDEYIVDFGTWLVPERMSLKDVQDIICAIDDHVGPYFEPTPGNENEK